MGNLFSSGFSTKAIENEKEALVKQIEKLKQLKSVSGDTIAELKAKLASQSEKIDTLNKAGRELLKTSKICPTTQEELKLALDRNKSLIDSIATLKKKHATSIQQKEQTVKKLQTELSNKNAVSERRLRVAKADCEREKKGLQKSMEIVDKLNNLNRDTKEMIEELTGIELREARIANSFAPKFNQFLASNAQRS